MTIFSLRGPGGSGKTHTMYELLKRFPSVPLFEPTWTKRATITPRAFRLPHDLYLLGRYTGANCSGVDGWYPNRIEMLIEHFAPLGHVLLESLIMSSTLKTFLKFADQYPLVFIYLDTPPDLCIQQIYHRNGGKPIKEKDITSHWRSIHNQRRRVKEQKLAHVEVIRHGEHAVDDLIDVLTMYGWGTDAAT